MRRYTLFLLALLLFTACSKPAAIPNPTPLPSPSPEPSKTPEPSPTPDTRYVNLMPETLEKCMEENVINWETRYADLAVLMKKVKDNFNISPEYVSELYPGEKSDQNKKEKLPEEFIESFPNSNSVPFDACAGLKMPDGKKLKVLVLPVKRLGSKTVVHLPLVYDVEAKVQHAKKIYYESGKIDKTIEEKVYQHMRNGTFKRYMLSITMKRSSDPETNKMWEDLLSLLPTEPDKESEYYQALEKYFLSKDSFSDEETEKLRSVLESNFLPYTQSLIDIPNF